MEEVVNLASLEGSVDFSMMGMFLKSDWVVKFVIILLVIFSIQSWKTIIQKIFLINNNGYASVNDNVGIGINPKKDFLKEFEVNE